MDLLGRQFESHLAELYNDWPFVMYTEAKKGHNERSKDTFKFYDGLSDSVMEDNVELLDEDGKGLAEG